MSRKLDPSLIPPSPNLKLEMALWGSGTLYVAGVDEAGRGALAGPVSAAALVFYPNRKLERELRGVRDSKQLTAADRETWSQRIRSIAASWSVGYASPGEIDALGIVPATQFAAWRAIETLSVQPDHIILDYLFLPDFPLPQTSLVKGDLRSLSVAGASILAKVARDAHLRELDAQYPGYGFANHKGYATRAHREAIRLLGPSPIHRMSFAPLRDLILREKWG